MDQEQLGKKLVEYTMNIRRKENKEGIRKAEKKYGKKVRKLLKGKITFAQAKKHGITKMLDELTRTDYGPLFIKSKGAYTPKTGVGNCVSIAFNEATRPAAESIRRECLKRGAHVIMSQRGTRETREAYLLPPLDTLAEASPMSVALSHVIDYSFRIGAIENEFWKGGIAAEKLITNSAPMMKIREIQDKKQQRWCLVGWPHPQIAKELGISPKEFERIVFGSIEESFSPRTIKLVDGYYKALKGAKTIRIVHDDGTDLTFSVKGREFLRDRGFLTDEDLAKGDVGMNIPTGEIFTAPVEHSANGVLKIPKNIIHGYGLAEGIELYFKNGEVVEYKAKKNRDHLTKFFAENTGEKKRIAELGIGCNSKAEFTNGYIIVDEKIKGTLHIAIGWNIGYGGKNVASSHLDFIKPMDKGRMYADGRLVMDHGRLVA